MLNPAYSLDEQAEELLAQAEVLFACIVPCDDLLHSRRAQIERWTYDLHSFQQRRLIAETAAPQTTGQSHLGKILSAKPLDAAPRERT
jgi:hypothetical protein